DLQHTHLSADPGDRGEVHDVLVRQAEAARRVRPSDGAVVVGAVNAIDGIAEIERARALRILQPARHRDRQTRLALVHLRWWRPRRPSGDTADALGSGPREAVAADGDRI